MLLAAMTDAPHTRFPPGPAQPLAPGLYVVSTPIGNLRDITLRALDILAAADLVLAEDTRVTRRLLDAYGLSPPLEPYHDHNAAAQRPRALARIAAGERVALVSDAGTPLISDPGFKLARDVIAAGGTVTPAPGASAPLAALVASGLPSDRFLFAGFPPAKSSARRAMLRELTNLRATLIFFEAGSRLAASLSDMAAVFAARDAALARELTKKFEEVIRAPITELADVIHTDGPPRGEFVVLIGPPSEHSGWSDEAVDAALAAALAEMSTRDAAAAVAERSGRPKRDVYARALALKSVLGS